MPEISKYGDWKQFGQYAASFSMGLTAAMERANQQVCMQLVQKIKKGIQKQAPAGQAFAALHPFTISEKRSSKALVDKGDLLNSITWRRTGFLEYFVGILRTARNQEGQPIINIAAIQEEGRTILVTPKMRAYLHHKGFHLKKGTTALHIPPRPFISPVVKDADVDAMINQVYYGHLSTLIMKKTIRTGTGMR